MEGRGMLIKHVAHTFILSTVLSSWHGVNTS